MISFFIQYIMLKVDYFTMKLWNRISSSFRQKIGNLFVSDFWKCWLPARCNTVWSFLFQIHLFKKEKKLSFVCWQHKSSKAIHNEVKSSMKLHLNLYVIYHHHRWNWMLLLPELLSEFWLEFLKIPMPSAPLTKFQPEKLTNDQDKNNIFSVLVNFSGQMILEE